MAAESAQDVLAAILSYGADLKVKGNGRLQIPTPQYCDLIGLCELLASEPGEERLQRYLEENPGFLTGLHGTRDNSDLGILYKPRIGTQYVADFAVFQASQGGSVCHLIEIETCHEPLFTKGRTPARRYRAALGQLEDWKLEIERQAAFYARDFLRMICALPLLGEDDWSNSGFRLDDPDKVEWMWKAFGGEDTPFFSYTAILGRWSKLSDEDKERILLRNRDQTPSFTFTYEQVARAANVRWEIDEW